MISLELSSIQYNSLQSAVINAQVEEFLRKGGEISSAPPVKPVPLPYGRLKPIDESTKLVRAKPKVSRKNPTVHSPELIARIADMAETMNCCDIAKELGMTYDQVRCIGSRTGVTFPKAVNSGRSNIIHNKIDEAADQKIAERIRAYRELGVSRRQCHQGIGIGAERFNRIIDVFGIDYPKQKTGRTWVKPS
jgi:hypothetical protein